MVYAAAFTFMLGAVLIALMSENKQRRQFARALIWFAGTINKPRHAEFVGELSMIQASPFESGMDYAVGAVVGSTLEIANRAKPLRIENVSKNFGDLGAVRGVTLDVPAGSITALVGGNGAGKTTLLNLLAGVHVRDGGTIFFDGIDIDQPGARDEIAFSPQDLGLIEDMTVAENLSLTASKGWIVRPHKEHLLAEELLSQIGVKIDPRTRVRDLKRSDRRLVAIAAAVNTGCRLLVMDEPSASLPEEGVGQLFHAMKALRHKGIGMLFVCHRIDEVFTIADRVAVLHDGVLVHDEAIVDSSPEEVFAHITGTSLEDDEMDDPTPEQVPLF